MSHTSTSTTKTKALQRSGSILLSPAKRRKHSNDADNRKSLRERPSEKEIWEWTLTTRNVSECYVRDAMAISVSSEGFDFFWLGSAPCRKVEVCGTVVGIQVLEKKVVYTIDDGTAVIDCVHRPPQPPQPREHKNPNVEPPPPPRPISRIGGVVKASGRIQPKFETRIMLVDTLSLSSYTAQLAHWKIVRELHRTRYNSSEPFVIPALAPETPRKVPPARAEIQAKSTAVPFDIPAPSQSTLASSPIAQGFSPSKTKHDPQSPTKLRHPSRLRSHQLTDAAFRLYVKHIIDNAPEDLAVVGDTSKDPITINSDSEEEFKELYGPTRPFTSAILGTCGNSNDHHLGDRTPRPKTGTISQSSSLAPASRKICEGFTLSYLRRVPELSLMAKRVVKERVREEEKKMRGATSRSTPKSSTKQPGQRMRLDKASLMAKKKRLFQWAVCELLREGSIVLWDGPKRTCPLTSENANATILWQFSSVNTTDNSLFSNASTSNSTFDIDEDLDFSDPEPGEEAYVSTKPEFLVPFVTDVLKALALAPPKRVLKRNELNGGSTKEEVLANLRRDDKWAFIGEWNVEEALEYMEREDLVWRVGSDRWLLTQ